MIAALTAAACSSATPDKSPADGSGSASSSTSASSISAIKAKVQVLLGPANKFVAPGPALDASSLSGKSVWFVPVSSEIPVLAVELRALRDASKTVGIPLHVCDGKLTPAVEAACISSAESAGAAGIIGDGVSIPAVQTAVNNATSHGVQVLAMGEVGTDTKNLRYFDLGDAASQAAAADWIIADSSGKANVLITADTDDAGASHDVNVGSKPEFSSHCPSCTVTTAGYTTGTVSSLSTLVSSALLRNRQVSYALANLDFLIP